MPSPPKAKNWCFTLNNYTNDDKERIAKLWEGVASTEPTTTIKYLVYGEEVGEQGTPHLQGYVSFVARRTLNQLKSIISPTAHFQIAKGSPAQNRTYCTKDGAYTEFGQLPGGSGTRTDLNQLKKAIKEGKSRDEIFEAFTSECFRYERAISKWIDKYDPPRNVLQPPKVVVLWGRTGTGKTRFVYDNHDHESIWNWPGGPWFDGYDGHEVALFDDFNGSAFPCQYMLKLLDRYPYKVPIKGGYRQWKPKTIYLTSNLDPTTWYQGANHENQEAFLRRLTERKHFS
jgi:hypothetical protein